MRKTLLRFVMMAVLLTGCSLNSAKNHYILAEKLWTDGKYAAAVSEFEKVVAKDPTGKLGLQALYRAATTQFLFLGQYPDAVRKFRLFADATQDQAAAWEAERQIGEILFAKTEQYDQAIQHYRALLRKRPDSPEGPEFLFRMGKSHFFLWKFDQAIQLYRELVRKHGGTPWAEKAAFEIGVTYFTRGEQQPGGQGPGMEAYQDAMDAYQSFLKRYPKSTLVSQAKFGIASCLEELDQLDAAYYAYEALKDSYPSPNVIKIKLARIHERKTQRSR